MTCKDYMSIAEALLKARTPAPELWPESEKQSDSDAKAIADVLAREDAAFDRARFLEAAGVQS